MRTTTRCREYREGWLGRRRNYLCRVCGDKFQHDGFQLPEKARICDTCLQYSANKATYQKALEEKRANE